MQTFLSENTFCECARALDDKRLNNQLLEGRQILKLLVINDSKKAWFNHPAVRQWAGYEPLLLSYLEAIRNECAIREIKWTTNWDAICEVYRLYNGSHYIKLPYWWSDKRELRKFKRTVKLTHRARLYVKLPEHYWQYKKWTEANIPIICCDHCNYFWPSHYAKKCKINL